MKVNFLKRIAILAIFILATHSVYAQNGTVEGLLTDVETKETIIGGNVSLEGTSYRAVTDIDGKFSMSNVKTGSYNLIITYIGYQPQTVLINVSSGKATVTNIALKSESTQMESVTITARANMQNAAALLSERKNASIVVQNIGAQEMDRKGISNVNEGLAQVSGVSVADNNALFIRGLGDRYNNATLNGLPIPSTNPDMKLIPLDIFPSSVVENIAVVKSYTAQFYGDFSGGSVDIVTKGYPSKPYFKVSLSSGYNSIVSGMDDFLMSPQSSRGFFGFDKNKREMPQVVAQKNSFNSSESGTVLTPGFATSWTPYSTTAPLNRGISISAGNRFFLKDDKRICFLLTLSHKAGYSYEDGVSALYNAQGSPRYRYDTQNYGYKTNSTALMSVTYGPNTRSNYTFTGLVVNQSNDNVFENAGMHSDIDNDILGRRNTLIQNSLYAGQINSNYDFDDDRKLTWAVGYTKTIGSIPDRVQNTFEEGSNGYVFSNRNNADNHRFFSELYDDEIAGKVEMDFQSRKEHSPLKSFQVGVNGKYKFRDFAARQIDTRIGLKGVVDLDNVEAQLSESNLTAGNWEYTETYYAANKYKANLGIAAPYINLNFNWNDRWNLVAGVRAEVSNQSLDYKTGRDAEDAPFRNNTISQVDILPGATLKYLLTEKSNFMLAASRTMSRPLFVEVAPFRLNNAAATAEQQGNPHLKNSSNYNLDLKYEIYPSRGELMAVSLFGKYIKDPIEMMQLASPEAIFSFVNSNQALVAGVEVEFNRNIASLLQTESDFLKNASIGFNGSYMYNEIQFNENRILELSEQGNSVAPTNRKRALYGASPYLINFDLSYKADWNKSTNSLITVAYNTFGKRLFVAGSQGAGDIFEMPFNSLDATINTMFNKHIGFDLSISNILNPTVKFEQEFDTQNLNFSEFKKGLTVGASLSYNF